MIYPSSNGRVARRHVGVGGLCISTGSRYILIQLFISSIIFASLCHLIIDRAVRYNDTYLILNTGTIITSDVVEAFKDAHVVLLLGAFPRGPGMERKDLLQKNVNILHCPLLFLSFSYLFYILF